MSQATVLQKLQTLEQNISRAQTRVQEIDDTIANDERIKTANDAVTTAQAQLPPLQKQVKAVEHELETVSEKSSETEERLYSGAVKNPKEMQEMQQEITLLKTKQSELEEDMLQFMEQLEVAEDTFQQQQANLEQVMQSQKHQHAALLTEREQRENEISRLQQQRAELVSTVAADALKLYEYLKPRTRGIVVAKMNNDGTCSVCGVRQDRSTESDVRRGNLTQCTNCRRILAFT